MEIPVKFKERMKGLLGDSYPDFQKALGEKPVKAFRVNTDKISLDDFMKINVFGTKKVPYTDSAFYLEAEKAGTHPYHHAGMIYIQEPAAMAPAECIDINPGWRVLDMCAAPGGKSTQIKNKLGDEGLLVSNEIIPSRCKVLTGNIERLGLKNTVTTCMDTNRLAEIFPETFDLIMCDAPCSGEGMFRKEEDALSMWSGENVRMCARRQGEILDNAAKCLKCGGYIIYATCTFSLEENEMNVDAFLKRHRDFEIEKVNKRVIDVTAEGVKFPGCETENINYARRFYPHLCPGEGQFMAVLHKKGEPREVKIKRPETMEKPPESVYDFLDDVLISYDKNKVKMYNGNPVYFRDDFNVKKGTAFSCGVTIGEIKKNIIKPHHQFFMAMGNDFKRKIDLKADSEEIRSYLHGEEFGTDCENGWAVIRVDGASAGGGKVSAGRCKNHYPKGLRTLKP